MKKETMTLNLAEREMTVLEELAIEKGMTKTAVLRQSLRLYQLAHERLKQGHRLFIEDEAKLLRAEIIPL